MSLRFTKPSDRLSETARKVLELPRVPPRVRSENEATSVIYCNANVKDSYRPGDGDSRRTSVRRVITTTQLLSTSTC